MTKGGLRTTVNSSGGCFVSPSVSWTLEQADVLNNNAPAKHATGIVRQLIMQNFLVRSAKLSSAKHLFPRAFIVLTIATLKQANVD